MDRKQAKLPKTSWLCTKANEKVIRYRYIPNPLVILFAYSLMGTLFYVCFGIATPTKPDIPGYAYLALYGCITAMFIILFCTWLRHWLWTSTVTINFLQKEIHTSTLFRKCIYSLESIQSIVVDYKEDYDQHDPNLRTTWSAWALNLKLINGETHPFMLPLKTIPSQENHEVFENTASKLTQLIHKNTHHQANQPIEDD